MSVKPGRRPWTDSRSGFGLAVAVFTVVRLPSFLEPHWYTDEAGYATTAREMLRGKVLYLDIWSNKPPLDLWTVAATLKAFGTSEVGFHFVTYASGLLTLAAVGYACRELLGPRKALVALLAVAVLIGTPILDAELLIPESLLIAPTAWAAALLLVRLNRPDRAPGWLWPAGVGLLAAIATAYQQTALADAAAFGLILRISPYATWRQALVYAATFAAATACWLAPSVILAGWSRVAYALAGFYVSYTAYDLPKDRTTLYVLGGSMLAAVALAGFGAYQWRRAVVPSATGLWSVATWLAAAAPQHPYPHLALPAVVPTVIFAAALWRRPDLKLAPHRFLRLGSAAIVVAFLISAGLGRVTGWDWMPLVPTAGVDGTRTMTNYYGGLALVVAGQNSLRTWRRSFDSRVQPDFRIAAWLKQNGLNGSTAVVWSSDPWLYLLSDLDVLLPTPPIYNNFALLGNEGQVSALVTQLRPRLIITDDADTAAHPEILPLLYRDYLQTYSDGEDQVWVPNPTQGPLARNGDISRRSARAGASPAHWQQHCSRPILIRKRGRCRERESNPHVLADIGF